MPGGLIVPKCRIWMRIVVDPSVPLGGFMPETDAPFLAPVPHRGKRCEPAHVADTAAFIAKEKNCTLPELPPFREGHLSSSAWHPFSTC
ncbi:MAG: TatD family hydrolase [Limisphaerales bacterium]